MSAILLNTLRGHRWPMLVTALLIAGFGIIIAISFDEAQLEFLSERMPRGVEALLQAEGNLLLASGVQGYLAIGFRHPLFLIVLSAFAISTASGALAREIEQRTILMVLARPLHRYQVVLGKGIESFMLLALLVVAMLGGTFIGVAISGLSDSVSAGPMFLIALNALFLALAVMGYSYLFSALSSDGGRATLLSTGVTLIFFLMDFIAGLFDVMEPLGPASIFHYYDPLSIAVDSSFPFLDAGVLLATAVITFVVALMVFQRRDIAA